MLCPRRQEHGDMSMFKVPEDDNWDHGYCSWCGSLPQEDLFDAIEKNAEIVPTDKNYKIYVRLSGEQQKKFYFQHLDEEGKAKFIELHNKSALNLSVPGYFYVMPYFCKLRANA